MGIDDDLTKYNELLGAGRYEEAALLGEALVPQLLQAARSLDAVEILNQTIKYSKSSIAIGQAWSQIGKLLYQNNLFHQARTAYRAALANVDSTDTLGMAQLLFAIGNTHLMQGNYVEAKDNYAESFRLSESQQFSMGILENASRLTNVMKVLQEFEGSRVFAERAILACNGTSNLQAIRRAIEEVAGLIAWLGRFDRKDDAATLLKFAEHNLSATLFVELTALLEALPE